MIPDSKDRVHRDTPVERVRENPYRLALDIHGIGFKMADAIAHRLGIPYDALIRAQAGVRHMLQEISGQGHCAAYRQKLVENTAKMLGVAEPIVETAIEAELGAENLVQETIEGETALFLSPLYRSEKGVASHLVRLEKGGPSWGEIDPCKAIPWVEEQTGLQLSPSQRRAVSLSVNGKVTVITGGPGVGKTTVVNSILTIVRAKGANVRLCAPTGRAAKRLSESTELEAKTVHRVLEFDPKTMGFKHDQNEPLDADLLVMDEVSMMDIVLMNHLLRAVPDHAAVLLVGDVDQLPSAVYVDAVEWVELPNTLGMSQYADGGYLASKPYVASGRYIDRMSNYCKGCRYNPAHATGDDACPYTTLYWIFWCDTVNALRTTRARLFSGGTWKDLTERRSRTYGSRPMTFAIRFEAAQQHGSASDVKCSGSYSNG